MKSISLAFSLLLQIIISTMTAQEKILPLDQLSWEFSAANDPIKFPAQVPGNVFLDLEKNGLLQNPLLGLGEEKAQWVSHQDWEYTTSNIICAPLEKGQRAFLHLPEIDTYCDVYWNGQFLTRTDNAFIHWKIDITDRIQANNQLRFVLYSPYKIAEQKLKKLAYPIPGDSIRAVTRKPQYEFGWDWGPKLAGCGIRQNPYIVIADENNIQEAYIKLGNKENDPLELNVSIAISQGQDLTVKVFDVTQSEIELLSKSIDQEKNRFPFTLPGDVKWSTGHSAQSSLRKIEVRLYKDRKCISTKKFTTAPRSIALIQEKDQWGTSFYFELNNKKIFIKGANYIPIKYFHEQATEADYRTLIERCKSANINMLRVWGGGIYEPDIFYDLCDEYGIMVWQDFMYACSMYPGDPAFMLSARQEAEEHVKRLSHHPCMALWCGNNENSEGWERWGWKVGLHPNYEKKLQRAYNDLFLKTLPETVKSYSSLPYWPSSPLWGRGDARSLVEGDSHYWGVWHDAENFEVLMTKIPRFMSEFGMQSYPSQKVQNEMCSEGKFHPKDPGIAMHQKHNRGFSLMHQYMQYWHPTGETLMHEDYALLTQYVQAEGMTMGIEAQRRHSDKCGGTMFWQLNDVWPSFSWSAMDWHFQPKPFLEQLTYAYGPYLASGEWNGKEWSLYIINEFAAMPNTHISIQYKKGDKILNQWTLNSNIEVQSQVVFKTKEIKPELDAYFVVICEHNDLPNHHYERKMKSKGISESFMVPIVENGKWSCAPLKMNTTEAQ
jgi:beta-mannosidase